MKQLFQEKTNRFNLLYSSWDHFLKICIGKKKSIRRKASLQVREKYANSGLEADIINIEIIQSAQVL